MACAADPTPPTDPIDTAVGAADTDLTWEKQGNRWFADLEGREHDYGDGSGPNLDVFTATLSPLTDGGFAVEMAHDSRGDGETAYLRGGLPQVQAEAERLLHEFRQQWEEVGHEDAERRESDRNGQLGFVRDLAKLIAASPTGSHPQATYSTATQLLELTSDLSPTR